MPKTKDGRKSTSKGRGKLTNKQQRFVEEYLIDLNATQAAIRAGYSEKTAEQMGYQLLQKTSVQNVISDAQNKRSARLQITQDDVLRDLLALKEICLGRQSVVLTDTVKNAQDGTVNAVESPVFVFEPSAANKALELLGKHLGMFKERVDVTSGDNPLPTAINVVFSDERD